MNVAKPKQHPSAPHFGPMPADEKLRAEIQALNEAGWPTAMASTWAALRDQGIDPRELLELA